MMYAFLSFIFTIFIMILSLLFWIARKLRLTLPFVYFLLISSILNPWASSHEPLSLGILLGLILLSTISWLLSFKNFLLERR